MKNIVCFCFGYTVSDIERDAVENGRSLIAEKIYAEKKAGGCDCPARNPSGR